MAQSGNTTQPPATVEQLAARVGVYPLDAYQFIQRGLHFTVARLHGDSKQVRRHVSGPQLSQGLRDFALIQWGPMAKAVLQKWNITSTLDFGRLVFAMVEAGILHKTDEDSLEDFRNVFDFATFDCAYCIESKL